MLGSFRTLTALLAVGFLSGSGPTGQVSAAPPNVIVVITDDQGYGDLSSHGNPILKTPQLDRLFSESLRLTDFHVAPMCTPTRGQLLTGRHCLVNGAMNVSSGRTLLRTHLPTMADLFAAAGYQCGQFGKWHLGDNYPYRPQDRGFHETLFYPSSHIGSAPDFWNNDYFDDTYTHNGTRRAFSGYTTDVFFTEAIRWMRGRAAEGEPFLCYLATAAAHGPLFVPAASRRPYEQADLPDLPPQQRENLARFFGMVANIDDNMGRLDEFLTEAGVRDNTILIFLTDNGGTVGVPVFNAGMRGRKIELYEGGHRVPCALRWPSGKLRAAGEVPDLTQVQDLLPTLLDLCGIERPAQAEFDGISLAPVLRDATSRLPDRTLFVQFSRMNQPQPAFGDAAVLWRRWRLVQDKELYDLTNDPAQTTNVLEQHPDVAARLRAEYQRWWEQVAPGINDFSAITIGADAENPLLLSPADWQDSFLDQGGQVRAGLRRNGTWNVQVEQAGEYVFELRRWPREAATPLRAGLARFRHSDGAFPAGAALPIRTVRLSIGQRELTQQVDDEDLAVLFVLTLEAGRTQLRTAFLDDDDQEICGAYYVYVRRQ